MKKEELIEFINDSYPIAITFDTSFLQKENYNFKTGSIYNLTNLKKYDIKFILHDIVYEESKKHIYEKISTALKDIKKLSNSIDYLDIERAIPYIGKVSKRMIKCTDKYAENILERFVKDFNIEKISCYYDNIVKDVLRGYFDNTAPFSDGKKEEFPDAFTLMSIEHWSSQNNILTICISCDKDWENYCENSEYLFLSKNIDYLFSTLFKNKIEQDDRISLVKGKIEHFIQSQDNTLTESISNAIGDTSNFYLDYESSYGCECEISEISLNNYRIDTYNILSIDDENHNKLIYSVAFDVYIDIHIEYIYEIYIYDSIDKDYILLSSGYRTIDTNEKIDVSIEFEGNNDEIINININIPNTTIDIGCIELDDEFYGSDDEE